MFGEEGTSIEALRSGSVDERISFLTECTTMLCIAMEEYIISFDLHTNVPVLLNAFPKHVTVENEEEAILIARALALILDVVPRSCPVVVQNNAVPKFISLLKGESNAALVEELLKCLDKISIENPQVLMVDGFVPRLLECLQTFNEALKIVALKVVANLCRREEFELGSCVQAIGERLASGSDDEVELICQVRHCFTNTNNLVLCLLDSPPRRRFMQFASRYYFETFACDSPHKNQNHSRVSRNVC